ncbi:MAG: polysaccharide deacetylase family protein [bacterium]|nr:polysaccharide deacetylase family protein [bacterium]
MKTHGDEGWQEYPSYLGVLVPRVLEFADERGLRMTVFVVGRDAESPGGREQIASIALAGHELGNHSFEHEPWMSRYTPKQAQVEIQRTEEAIAAAAGVRPRGFRGPGYALSLPILQVLVERGYRYDASTLPSYLGPLARAYYLRKANLSEAERAEREVLFGSLSDGLRPSGAYEWNFEGQRLLEIPVTTLPGIKLPFHLSYVLYLSTFSPALARSYFRNALRVCRWFGVEPSILLHPLDFLGADDVDALAFFPGMSLSGELKRRRVSDYLEDLARDFEVMPVIEHSEQLLKGSPLRARTPEFS